MHLGVKSAVEKLPVEIRSGLEEEVMMTPAARARRKEMVERLSGEWATTMTMISCDLIGGYGCYCSSVQHQT